MAIECSAMAEKLLGSTSRSTAAARTCLSAHRNESRRPSGAREPLARSGCTRHGPERRGEMSKSSQHLQLSEALDRFGAERCHVPHSGHYRQPLAFSRPRSSRPGAAERVRTTRRAGGRGCRGRVRRDPPGRVLDALADDFTLPGPGRRVRPDREATGVPCSAQGPSPICCLCSGRVAARFRRRSSDPEAQELLVERERARVEKDFGGRTRSRPLAGMGWTVRDKPEGARLVRSR